MLVIGALVLAAGCSSGGGSGEGDEAKDPLEGDGRGAYVAAFEVASEPVTEEVAEETTCVAGAVVDGVGVEELRGVATPREIAAAATGEGNSLQALGVDVDGERADAIFRGVKECGDLGEMFVRNMGEMVGPAIECFQAKLDDELLREIVMTQLVEGDAAFAGKPEITAKLMEIGRSCATA